MEKLLEGASWLCTALVVMGALGQLAPKDKMVQFIEALAVLTLLTSAGAALLGARWDFDLPELRAQKTQGELTEFINTQYESATEAEAQKAIEGLLGAAGLSPKKITVRITSSEKTGIVLAKVSAAFDYPQEGERAYALLRNVLGEDVVIEVQDGA